MKKIILLAITCMLVLASCDDNDEPGQNTLPNTPITYPFANDPVSIYVSFIENNQDFIYDLNGELIYQAEPGKRITYLTADGQNWYAVYENSVLKNGEPLYSTDNEINGLAVYHGDFYTLEAEPLYTSDPYLPSYYGDRWSINKNGSVLYLLAVYSSPEAFYNLRIHPKSTGQPDVVVDSYTGYGKCPWVNGQEFSLPDVDHQDFLCFDVCDNQPLMCYWDYSLQAKYWFNGKETSIDSVFPIQASIYDGKPYIIGKTTEISGIAKDPILIADGQETILENPANPNKLTCAESMLRHGENLYVLCSGYHYSIIFKNNMPIIPTVSSNDESTEDNNSISNHYYRGFIVVDKPSSN